MFEERVFFLCLRSAQALAIFTIAEHVQFVQWRIAGLVGNTLRIDRLDKLFRRDAGKLLIIKVENVSVLTVTRAALVKLLRLDAGYLAQLAIQDAGVLVPALSPVLV